MITKNGNEWQYMGDINLEYGGYFYQLTEWDNGYVDAVRITDLDSGCGFAGAVLVEKITVLIDPEYFARALDCCGWDVADIDVSTDNGKSQIVDALIAYGRFDPVERYYAWENPTQEVIQTDEDGPMEFDGWKASKRVFSKNLMGYLEAKYLD